MRTGMLSLLLGLGVALVACHHGRDTGPKQPLAAAPFKPLVERFGKRVRACFPESYKKVLRRDITDADKGATAKIDKAISGMRKQLLQCLTGVGYGNEPNAQAKTVEGWLAYPECPKFANDAFTTQCSSALSQALIDAGFKSDVPNIDSLIGD